MYSIVPMVNDFAVVQSLRRVRLCVTPWTAARQASLSITISQSLLKLMSSESVIPSNHLILCPLAPRILDLFDGLDAAVQGDEEVDAVVGGPVQALVRDAVALVVPVGNVG